MAEVVAGIRIPDSKLAREATDLLRKHGTPLLLAHSLTTFGTMNSDVLERTRPGYRRPNFCDLIAANSLRG
jgi:hypothetical protein